MMEVQDQSKQCFCQRLQTALFELWRFTDCCQPPQFEVQQRGSLGRHCWIFAPVKDKLCKLLATKDTSGYSMLSGAAEVCQMLCPELLVSVPLLAE